jgi:hypothetical protein
MIESATRRSRPRRSRGEIVWPDGPFPQSVCLGGPKPFCLFLMAVLTLTPVAQACWFLWAWRVIGAVARPGRVTWCRDSG